MLQQSTSWQHQPSSVNLLRTRYQIPFGILIGIIIPGIISARLFGVSAFSIPYYNTFAGLVIALIFGYAGYRRLQVFPGIAAGGYIFTSFSISFGALATALIVSRLDFSRTFFVISYIVTILLYTTVHLRYTAHRQILLAVIPGGSTEVLPLFRGVTWHRLASANDAVPPVAGVVADLRADHSNEWNSRITNFVVKGVPVYDVRESIEQITGRVEIDHLSDNTLGSLNPNDVYLKTKAGGDFIIALVALILLAPLFIIVALAIKLDSPGPVFFRQQRIGFRTKPFSVVKFRTMRVADNLSGNRDVSDIERAMTQVNDPRITRVGAFLRKTRLDELPQLANIIRSEMSLIGPRPEAIPLSKWYEGEIPFYHYRHIIKPGITGWAQVNQGHVTGVGDVRRKLHYDFYYVKNFSFWLDLLIVLRTAHTVITGTGAR